MRQVRIAELKSHLSGYLRAIRAGETISVLDRDTPVAPTALGTLDAIHPAQAHGLPVIGS